ncbi:Glutamate receptor ionotropic, kainate 2 [Eumeta japonica]|uniref:Glutamate receptor ionotropic, kainate 2 n=1 Tax=Eumeta variegata TaxID=151549 RepID=A0A4C1WAQ2_EUMVA|nr:Glutamate receptor ionotropic, kainate 2 [Eumeta japonica]
MRPSLLVMLLLCGASPTLADETEARGLAVGVLHAEPTLAMQMAAAADAALTVVAEEEKEEEIGTVTVGPAEPGEPVDLLRALCQLAELGTVVWVCGACGGEAVALRAAAARAGLLQLSVDRASLETGSDALGLYPPADVLAQVAAALMNDKSWQRVVLLHETVPPSALLALTDAATPIAVTVRRLPPPLNDALLRNLLLVLKRSGVENFAVWCGRECILRVLDAAQRVGLLSTRQSYLLLDLDIHTLQLGNYSYGGTNITGIRLFDPSSESVQGAMEAWRKAYLARTKGAEEDATQAVEDIVAAPPTALLLTYDAVRLAAMAWRALGSPSLPSEPLSCTSGRGSVYTQTLLNYMRTMEISGTTGPLQFEEGGQRAQPALEVVELDRGGRFVAVARWMRAVGGAGAAGEHTLLWTRAPVLTQTDSGDSMTNRSFNILIALKDPYIMHRESAARLSGNERFEGFCVELIELLADALHFNYTFILHDNSVYGSYNNKTGWNGMMRRLLDDELLARLRTYFGDEVPCTTTIYNWFVEFKHGRVNLGDGYRDGRSSKAVNNKNIDVVRRMIQTDRHVTCYELRCTRLGQPEEDVVSLRGTHPSDISSQNIHFAITDLTITAERERAVDFTTPFMNLGISILFTQPTEPTPAFFAFLLPFSPGVWGFLGLAYLGTTLLLYVVGRLCPEEWQNPYPCIEEPTALENQFTLQNAFWFTLGSVLLQGSEIAPVAYGTRSVASMWWLFALVITSSYTANLATLLAKKTTADRIHDVKELANNEEGISYGATFGGSTYDFFQKSQDPLYQKMYEHMQNEVMPANNTAGIDKVLDGDYAFLMESTTIEYLTQRNCEVKQVGGQLDSKGYGIAMKKNSTYRQELNLVLLNLQENGILREMKHKWWNERHGGGACKEDTEVESEKLSLRNFKGLFFVLLVGSILGVVLSFVDLTLHARRSALAHGVTWGSQLWAEIRFVFQFERGEKPLQLAPSPTPEPSPQMSPPHSQTRSHTANGEGPDARRRSTRHTLRTLTPTLNEANSTSH